jgi:hypothetical protein
MYESELEVANAKGYVADWSEWSGQYMMDRAGEIMTGEINLYALLSKLIDKY